MTVRWQQVFVWQKLLSVNCLWPWAGSGLMSMLLWCLLTVPCTAQTYRFDHWTTNEGLPQNHITAIVQTQDGYIWFTTFDGLVRYDGIKFKVFDRKTDRTIPSNRFTALFEDAQGTLWAGTEDAGLVCYRNGVFTAFTQADGLPQSWITGIQADTNGRIIVTTPRAMVYWNNGKFFPVTHQIAMFSSLVGRSGTRWVVDETGVHWCRNGDCHDLFLPFYKQYPSILGNRPHLYEDRDGNLWICSIGNKLVQIRNGRLIEYDLTRGELLNAPTDRNPKMKELFVIAATQDLTGNVWFGTTNGLLRFQQDRFSRYTTQHGLSSNMITGLMTDREGIVWVGTHDQGLNRVTQQFITTLSVEEGLPDREVYPILQDRAGQIWVGSINLSKFDGTKFTVYKTGFADINNQIQALYEDTQGRLWIGAYGGICYFEQGQFFDFSDRMFATLPQQFHRPNCNAIFQDSQQRLWFGTDRGLFKYEQNQLTPYTVDDGLPSNTVKTLFLDREGTFWVGTYGGAAYLDGNRWVSLTERDGLASNKVRTITQDSIGNIWIGTYDGGISRYKDGKLSTCTVENGLFSNGVFAMLEGRRDNFWMSSNQGIFRVNKQELNDFADGKRSSVTSVAYGRLDGMRNTECNGGRQPAGVKTRDDKLWFPTMDGVAVVDLNTQPINHLPPQVLFESAVIDKTEFPITDRIQLQPGQTYLEINYTGLSFTKPEQVQFKYKLQGLDPDWINVGTRRTAYYSYVPPGTYRFTVLAANSDGIWSQTGPELIVEIIPPVYRRRWFQALIALGLAGCGWGIYRLRIAQLQREHHLREAFSQQLLASQEAFSRELMTSQEQERKRIAAELHDSIGQSLLVIKNRALLGLKTSPDPKTREQLEEINGSVSEALTEVRSVAYNLRPIHLERLGLTSTLEEMIETVSEASGIEIHPDIAPLDDLFSKEDEIHFFRILQECLNNIVKHSQATEVELTIYRQPTGVTVTVQDNGKGFSDAPQSNSKRNGSQSGFGLTGIAERVRMLGGHFEIHSVPNHGTTVSIFIVSSQ